MTPAELRRLAEAAGAKQWKEKRYGHGGARFYVNHDGYDLMVDTFNAEATDLIEALPSLLDDNEALRARLDEAEQLLRVAINDGVRIDAWHRIVTFLDRHDAQPPHDAADTEVSDAE